MTGPLPVVLTPAEVEKLKDDIRAKVIADMATPPVQETWWQQIRPLLTPIILIVLTIVGTIGVQNKWWTAEQFQKFQQVIVDQQTGETTTVTTMTPVSQSGSPDKHNIVLRKPDGTTTAITKPNQSVDTTTITTNTTPTVAAMPDWMSKLADWAATPQGQKFIQGIINKMIEPPSPTPHPNPEPTPNPQPTPQPPIPMPTPIPQTGLKLSLTDSSNTAITSSSIAVGRLVRVMAVNAPSKIGWKASDHGGSVEIYALPQKLGYDFVLKDTSAYVEITAFDADLNQVSLRVTALNAPMPPPGPTPVPDGDTDTRPSKQRKLSLSVVEDTQNRSSATASVLRSLDVWNGFRDKGHDWRFYDKTTNEQKGRLAVTAAGGIEPALVIRDLTSGELLTVVALPKTVGELTALVSKWSAA